VLSDLALLASEAVNVPLSPSCTREQIEHVLADANVDWILTDQAEGVLRDQPELNYVATSHRTGLSLLRRDAASDQPRGHAADIGKVIYPSDGAKGVSLRQCAIQSLVDALAAATAGLGVQTHLCILPLASLLESIAGVYLPLTMGAKVLVRPRHTLGTSHAGLNVTLLLNAIDSTAPDSMILVPPLLSALVRAIHEGWRAPSSLKFIAVGEDVSTELLQQARSSGLPMLQVRIGALGETDAAPNVTVS
jgi:long-subunit acyl-CoA synthetase (AMP-forming)